MIHLLWSSLRDEEAAIAKFKATKLKQRVEKWNLIEFDENNEDHSSILVQCTNKTCSLRNKPLQTTHVISAEDAGDDNVNSYNQKCHVYLVDSEDEIDMENPIYCPQDDSKRKGSVNEKIKNFFQTDDINQPPNGDGEGVGKRDLTKCLNNKDGGYVKKGRFFIKRESPPAFKAVVESCSKCTQNLKTVDKSDGPKTITIKDLMARERAGQIG